MQSDRFPIGCLVMAAGNATRFGTNKLSAEVGGKSLIRRALEAVPAEKFAAVAVVTQYDEVATLAQTFGFTCIRNRHPEWGVSHTVHLGVEQFRHICRAILFQVADQPLLRRQSVAALVDDYLAHPDTIVAMGHGGVRGNPCIFPADCFPALMALTGDTGGSAVIRQQPARLRLFEVDSAELLDADTPDALRMMPPGAST